MAQGIQFTSYIPTTLVGVNSPSPTLAADPVTGSPTYTGALPGNVFYLSEQQAGQLSNGVCHAGWYMVAQVDASATVANIKFGTIGSQVSIPTTTAQEQAGIPPQSVVTDGATAATAGTLGNNPVLFLGAVTAGYYTIVQVGGDASLLLAASQTVTAGTILVSATPGTVATSTTYTGLTVGLATQTFNSPGGALTLTSVAASSGGTAVYTGTITGGTTPNYVGETFVIAGFANAVNNGTFICTACSTTTLTLKNANAVAETHAGTATSTNLIRANLSFPFGIV